MASACRLVEKRCFGLARLGLAWLGLAWLGLAWLGLAYLAVLAVIFVDCRVFMTAEIFGKCCAC